VHIDDIDTLFLDVVIEGRGEEKTHLCQIVILSIEGEISYVILIADEEPGDNV
jgi:hypothetical protein